MDYRIFHSQLIQLAGGEVEEDLFVIKPGVCLNSVTRSVTPSAILDLFNIDKELSDAHKLLELNSKITYLTHAQKGKEYVEDIYNNKKHVSISNNFHVGFLVAGASGETLLEFVSSNANIDRLTTSRTKANEDTLYIVEDDLDKEYIKEFIGLRKLYLKDRRGTAPEKLTRDDIERANKFNLFTKALSFTVSMSLDNWLWYLDKKISQDYEYEFKAVCIEIKRILNENFPDFVES